MKLEEQVVLATIKAKYGKYYAVWALTFSNKFNLKVFDQMKRNGWELISINWADAVFKKTRRLK